MFLSSTLISEGFYTEKALRLCDGLWRTHFLTGQFQKCVQRTEYSGTGSGPNFLTYLACGSIGLDVNISYSCITPTERNSNVSTHHREEEDGGGTGRTEILPCGLQLCKTAINLRRPPCHDYSLSPKKKSLNPVLSAQNHRGLLLSQSVNTIKDLIFD